MSIYNYLTHEQVDKIKTIIRSQCDEAARKETREAIRISQAVYDRLKKGRKAHDITADVYVGFFYPENRIEGLDLSIVENGIYSQPELTTDRAIVHIYHQSNSLNSKLVKDRAAKPGKSFFCIRFAVDKSFHLKTIEAVHVSGADQEVEEIYRAPDLSAMVG